MFQNSGAEATEAAIKVARRYFYTIGKPNKTRILCIKNSFHGTIINIEFNTNDKYSYGQKTKLDNSNIF